MTDFCQTRLQLGCTSRSLKIVPSTGLDPKMTVFGRFPYPVTATFIQISITTLLFYGLSGLCSLVPWQRLQSSIKSFFQPSSNSDEIESLWPATDVTPSDWEPFRQRPLAHPEISKTTNDFRTDWRDVVEVLPLAVVFLLKLVLENIFVAYVTALFTDDSLIKTNKPIFRNTQPPTYILLRISIIPMSLLLNSLVTRTTTNSVLAAWSAFLASIALLIVTIPLIRQVNFGNITFGLLSSFSIALLPLLLFRKYHTLSNSFAIQRHMANELDPEFATTMERLRTREWLGMSCSIFNLTARISTFLSFLFMILSGELQDILNNCYVLNTKNFWLLVIGSGALVGTIVLLTFLLSILATPATPAVLSLPENVVQILIIRRLQLPLSSWLDIGMCWLSSMYFLFEKPGKESSYVKALTSGQKGNFMLRYMLFPAAVYAIVHYVALLTQTGAFNGHKQPSSFNNGVLWTNITATTFVIKDDYLGFRPNVDTVADLSLLQSQCHEISGRKGIDDVVHCLSYLRSDDYLSLPAAGSGLRASEQDPRKANFANADGHENTLSKYDSPSAAQSASASLIGTCAGPIIPFHVYWTGPMTWRVELFIKAYLYTQNLPCSRLWLWLDCDLDSMCMEAMGRDRLFQRFIPLVERGDIVLQAWKFPSRVPLPKGNNSTDDNLDHSSDTNEAGGRVLAKGIVEDASGQRWLMLNPTHIAFSPVLVSDAVRFIVLHQHGGLYCDMDILLMRDMRPMLLPDPVSGPRAFAEEWVERAHPADYNTAVISLPANSSLSTYLLRGGFRMGLNFHPKAIGLMMWRDGRNGELARLHNSVFDPLVTSLRREGTSTCTVPCHKNFQSAFMSHVENAPMEWSAYNGKQLGNQPQEGSENDGSGVPTNRTMENFFRGAWAYHIHNQVMFLFLIGSLLCLLSKR